MKVAILDDEEFYRTDLLNKLSAVFSSTSLDVKIDIYSSATGLLPFVDQYQLIFVDYKLTDCTGMDFASMVREKNNAVGIVFVSNYPEYVFDTFKVKAYRFLRKPIDVDELKETVLSFLNEDDGAEKIVLFNYVCDGRKFTETSKIMYVESHAKHSFVTFNDKSVHEIVSGFTDTVNIMSLRDAAIPSRGILVCFPYVKEYRRADVLMKDGHKFSVSRNCRSEFEAKWINYLKNKK